MSNDMETKKAYVRQNEESQSAQAWENFLKDLHDAGKTILSEFGATYPRERAEGFRYLTRLVSIGLDLHLEHDDAEHPTFTRMISDTRKYIGDNPDTEYDYVTLHGDIEYLVKGKRGVSDYLAFCLYGINDDGKPNIGANISDKDIEFDTDGNFELYLSKENKRKHPNWLELADSTTSMVVRQYFTGDRSKRGTYTIETLSKVSEKPLFDEQQLVTHLTRVTNFVKEI